MGHGTDLEDHDGEASRNDDIDNDDDDDDDNN